MICTEEEAREKWCPHIRVSAWDNETMTSNTINDHDDWLDEGIVCCRGGNCMMWVPTDDGRGSCGLSRG